LREVFANRASSGGGVQDLFNLIDTDGNGSISLKEFKVGLAKMGLTYLLEDSDDLFNTLDRDGNQKIDLQELNFFLYEMSSPKKSRRRRRTKPIVPTQFSDADRPDDMSAIQYLNHIRRQQAGPAMAKAPPKRRPNWWIVGNQPMWEVTVPSSDMLNKVNIRDRREQGKKVVAVEKERRKKAILQRDEWAHDAWTHGQSSTWTPLPPNTEPGGHDTAKKRVKRRQKWLLLAFYGKHAPSKANALHVDDLLRRLAPANIEAGLRRKYGRTVNLTNLGDEEEDEEHTNQQEDEEEEVEEEVSAHLGEQEVLAYMAADEAMLKLLNAMMLLQMRPMDVFTAVDINHDRQISKEELELGLKRLGCAHLEDADIQKMVAVCDIDRDGNIDVREWKEALTEQYHDRHHEQTKERAAPKPVAKPPPTLDEEFDTFVDGAIGKIERWVDVNIVHGEGTDPLKAGDGALAAADKALYAASATAASLLPAEDGVELDVESEVEAEAEAQAELDEDEEEEAQWEAAREMGLVTLEDELDRNKRLREIRQSKEGGVGKQFMRGSIHKIVHLVETGAPDWDLEDKGLDQGGLIDNSGGLGGRS
jgi:Ca2+-binding EF-hand superfamily protein